MELAEGGSLFKLMDFRKKLKNPLSDTEASIIIKQILSALYQIHKMHILHRDIKPKNILMRSQKKIQDSVLIADFGLCILLDNCNNYQASERCGTMIYMAPEQFQGNLYTTVFN